MTAGWAVAAGIGAQAPTPSAATSKTRKIDWRGCLAGGFKYVRLTVFILKILSFVSSYSLNTGRRGSIIPAMKTFPPKGIKWHPGES
jgi:hypothetical protein